MSLISPATPAKTRAPETEKVTINLGFVDLGHIDLDAIPPRHPLGDGTEDRARTPSVTSGRVVLSREQPGDVVRDEATTFRERAPEQQGHLADYGPRCTEGIINLQR